MEGFVDLQHLEYPIVVFELEKALLGLYEDQASIGLFEHEEVLQVKDEFLVKLHDEVIVVFSEEV